MRDDGRRVAGDALMSKQVSLPSSADVTEIKNASALVGNWKLFWVRVDGSTAFAKSE